MQLKLKENLREWLIGYLTIIVAIFGVYIGIIVGVPNPLTSLAVCGITCGCLILGHSLIFKKFKNKTIQSLSAFIILLSLVLFALYIIQTALINGRPVILLTTIVTIISITFGMIVIGGNGGEVKAETR